MEYLGFMVSAAKLLDGLCRTHEVLGHFYKIVLNRLGFK